MKRWVFLLSLGFAGALIVRFFFFEGIYIATESMEPTLGKGRHVFVNKMALKTRKIGRGDIVVFKVPQGPDKDLVKRVIAVENDVIKIDKKRVYLNDVLLHEPYVQHLRPDEILENDNMAALLIPPGYVFVMGDNRDMSRDSRDWMTREGDRHLPYVPVTAVKGVVVGVK